LEWDSLPEPRAIGTVSKGAEAHDDPVVHDGPRKHRRSIRVRRPNLRVTALDSESAQTLELLHQPAAACRQHVLHVCLVGMRLGSVVARSWKGVMRTGALPLSVVSRCDGTMTCGVERTGRRDRSAATQKRNDDDYQCQRRAEPHTPTTLGGSARLPHDAEHAHRVPLGSGRASTDRQFWRVGFV
jgi:hypothetical protein